mgnify:CR=1 FL=1
MVKPTSKSNSTASGLKINISHSFVVKALHVGLNLFLIRFIIGASNEENYGFWLTFLSVFTLFSCIEVGLNNGFRKAITSSFETKDSVEYKSTIREMFSQSIVHYFGVFIIVGLAILLLPIDELFSISFISEIDLKLTLILCLLLFCAHFVFFSINTILLSIHRAKDSYILFFLQSLVQMIGIFLLSHFYTEIKLIPLCIAMSLGPIVTWAAAFLFYRRSVLSDLKPHFFFRNWKSRLISDKATSRFFLLQLGLLLLLSTDNLLIMRLISPSEVTAYQVALRYFNILLVVFNIILVPFWSAFTKEHLLNSMDWISKKLFQLFLIWLLLAIGAILMLVVSDFAYQLWIGSSLGISLMLSSVVALYTLQTLWVSMFSYYLYAIEKLSMLTKFYLLAALMNIPLSYWLSVEYEVAGIIGASLISLLPLSVYLPMECKKELAQSYE